MFINRLNVRIQLLLSAFFITFLLTGLAAQAQSGTVFYVDAALGDDGNACTAPGADACATIGAAIAKASAGDTIHIAAGIYAEHLQTSINNLSLVGAGADTTIIDGGGTGRVLWNTLPATISDITIRNGFADSSDLTGYGGGIFATGSLTLTNVTVMSNSASSGGGITVRNAGVVLTLQSSRVISNSAIGSGGGVYAASSATANITDTVIAGNRATLSGGGVSSTGATVSLTNTTLHNNVSDTQFGGGFYLLSGTMMMANSAIHHNQAAGGGGVYLAGGSSTLTNVTINENTGTSGDGGIRTQSSSSAMLSITNATIANNHDLTTAGNPVNGISVGNSTTITVKSTIIANNDNRNCSNTSPPTSAGYNVVDNYDCQFFATGDQQNVDPMLGTLGDYGGATWTMPVLIGSPAIDAADNAACTTTDQRGIARFDGDVDGTVTCDVGAYEAQNQLTISDISLLEGDSGTLGAVFTVTLAPTTTQVVSVTYATADGSAAAGSDYTATGGALIFNGGSVVFEAGETTKTITVPIIGDTVDETDETFTLTLSNPANAELIDAVGLGTIVDDDGLSSLTIADATVTEGDSGTVNAAFAVTLSPAAGSSVTVDYATADGTATAGSDYTAAGGTLTFNAGETTKTISVTVAGDAVDEGSSETFTVDLSNPSGATLADAQAVGTITDDDDATFSLTGVSDGGQIPEGDSGTTPAVFTVTLSIPTQFVATVDYTASGGNGSTFATAGVDFITTTGTLTFAAGETLHTITVPVIGDRYLEEDEYFSVNLSNGSVPVFGTSAGVTILNDDLYSSFIYLPLIVR